MNYWRSRIVTLLVTLITATGLITVTSQTMALTDTYFVTGQDLDFIMESDKTYAMEELEYELRKIPLFREAEDFFFNLQDNYVAEED